MVITNKDLVEFRYDVFQPHLAHCTDEPVHFFTFPGEFLPAGFPLHSEFPVLTFRTVVRESEEGKCLRFLSTFPAFFFRKTPEFYQTALFLLQFQLLWSSIFVTLMANKIGGLQFGIYRNCQISSRVFHTAVAALPLTKANRSDFE